MDAISYSYADKAHKRIEKFIKNPDSNSGIVTVPKVIGAGENITIPAGRMAVLPNVQVDGTLNVEGEVFIPTGATFSKVVDIEGNQTIDGFKRFSSSPIVPTPTTGDNSTKVATTAFVKAKSEADSIGVNQTWQDMTESRSMAVTYTNTTGKPIVLSVITTGGGSGSAIFISVNGILIVNQAVSDACFVYSGTVIIPNNNTYIVEGGEVSIRKWLELR